MFFQGWSELVRVLVVGPCAYLGLVVALRFAGKRTLAKMNAFDLVVTVALGSTLASIVTSDRLALAEGMTALALLIALQVIVARVAARWPRANAAIKSQPTLLLLRGQFLREAMTSERITEDDVLSAVRRQGFAALEDVETVVLESSGDLSVISSSRANAGDSALPGRARETRRDDAYNEGTNS